MAVKKVWKSFGEEFDTEEDAQKYDFARSLAKEKDGKYDCSEVTFADCVFVLLKLGYTLIPPVKETPPDYETKRKQLSDDDIPF